jgi:hypothetical protein
MPEVIDTPEELEAHAAHKNEPQPDICDLCWIQAPFTPEELADIAESEADMSSP